MIKKLCALAVGTLVAASAQAAFINGSLSANGFFTTTAAPGATSIVGNKSPIDVAAVALTGSYTGAFVGGSGLGAAFPFLPPAPAFTWLTADGFTFTVLSITSDLATSPPLTCGGTGTCVDSRTIDMAGVVTKAGFDPTGFTATWTGNGSCVGSGGACTETATASWSASVSATGQPVQVPEPATLALLGLAMAGLGLSRRRKI